MSSSVYYEATPNPQALKFVLDQFVSDGVTTFNRQTPPVSSPLAEKLLGFPWAEQVLIGPNFVTVVKQDWVEWSIIAEPLSELIRDHLQSGEPVLYADQGTEISPSYEDVLDSDSDIVKTIKQILNSEIRPAVARDGGDIAFDRFENDILYLQMRGSCSGCPSSRFTLKDGIETRLKRSIPNLKEVVSV